MTRAETMDRQAMNAEEARRLAARDWSRNPNNPALAARRWLSAGEEPTPAELALMRAESAADWARMADSYPQLVDAPFPSMGPDYGAAVEEHIIQDALVGGGIAHI